MVGCDVGFEPQSVTGEVHLARQTGIGQGVKAVIHRCARRPGVMAIDGCVDLVDSRMCRMLQEVLKNRITLRGAAQAMSPEGIRNAGPRRSHSGFRLILNFNVINLIVIERQCREPRGMGEIRRVSGLRRHGSPNGHAVRSGKSAVPG